MRAVSSKTESADWAFLRGCAPSMIMHRPIRWFSKIGMADLPLVRDQQASLGGMLRPTLRAGAHNPDATGPRAGGWQMPGWLRRRVGGAMPPETHDQPLLSDVPR